ncbi:MAG TPA: nitroreductase family protein [Hyphomicrobiaceae bacterium]|nr:nitroreductase family protein [Hyphomicrobiaceae bacterium]
MRSIKDALDHRYGDFAHPVDPKLEASDFLRGFASRGVCRRFRDEPVPAALIDTLAALALASPSKSDLQQRDILVVEDKAIRDRINTLLADQDWIPKAPHFLVFLGNNRRQRQVHDWTGIPFANDHLDAFFNAAVDAGIALSAFVLAAEAAGLGCCPISVIRNHAQEVSELLGLPDHVFPVAGLGLGWPQGETYISLRLPLAATLHRDRYRESTPEIVTAYDRRRNGVFPYRQQRNVARFGTSNSYGWSEDKARQYAEPERADFGRFVNAKGFNLK